MNVTPEEYLEQRLDNQIDWYSKKSAYNQSLYKRLQLTTIIFSSSIPFLTAYASDFQIIQIIIGIIGVTVATIAAVNGLYKFQENWISYRSISESLKQQKFLYLTSTDPYHEDNAFNVLVQNTEILISKEVSTWTKQLERSQNKRSSPHTTSPVISTPATA